MLDISVAYNRYKFIGNEFLTWLWYAIENEPGQPGLVIKEDLIFSVGNRMVLENTIHNAMETITIKGDDAGLEEGLLSLGKGAFVTELNINVSEEEKEWCFTIKGESLNISKLKIPETGRVEDRDDIEGATLEKIFLYGKILEWIDSLYSYFIKLRISSDWESIILPQIIKWIEHE